MGCCRHVSLPASLWERHRKLEAGVGGGGGREQLKPSSWPWIESSLLFSPGFPLPSCGAALQKTQGVLLLFIPALPSLIYCHLFAGPQGQWAGRGPRPACYYPGKCSLQNDDPADKPRIEESPAGKQSLAPDLAQHCLPSQEVASGCSEGSWGYWIPTSCPAPSSSPGREADPEPIYAH